MTWYEFAVPSVFIALLVRLEATFVGGYWSWIELFPDIEEESAATRATRRKSLWRRVAVPGVVAFAIAAVWPARFDEAACALVGLGGAALLLWPIVFHGLPWGMRTSDWQVPALYGGLLVAFAASGWLGGHIVHWSMQQEGGLGEVLRENVISLVIGAVLVGAATTVTEVASTAASRQRQDRRSQL